MTATMSNVQKTVEMARRVGLSRDFAIKVFYMGLRTMGGRTLDMTVIARAIKYAGDNKHLLKPENR